MPRPKRQRPQWLPSWVPFKDGRYLGLARQTILAWISAMLALSFFSMTVSYATEKSSLSSVRFVYESRSNTLMVLRVLSEAAGVFMAATVYSTFEVVQWVLISRPEGIRFPQFLALQPSTGPLGLLVLALGRGLPPSQWPMKPRIISLFRLVVECAMPVLGVLIMSNVNTQAIQIPIEKTIKPFAVGMTPFNGSVAAQLGVMQDLTFNIGYVSFLSSPLHAIDITSSSANGRNCAKGISLTSSGSCSRTVLITQELQNVEANLPPTQNTESQVLISINQQVYSLEYEDNIEIPQNDLKCKDFNAGPASYHLCLRNGDDGKVQASIAPCPFEVINKKQCLEDRSWRLNPGFATSLRPAFLNASVSYDRQDGRILSHEAQTDAAPVSLNASEILDAFSIILDPTFLQANSSTANPILGSPTHFFGRLIAAHMYRISKLTSNNDSTAYPKGINAVQSLLGLLLFYCQDGILGQTALPFATNATAAATQFYNNGAFEKPKDSALVALAETRYQIQVGRATLVAYLVLGGLTLLLSILALIIGSVLELAKFDAEPTLWPALDFFTQCRVEDSSGKVVPAHKRSELAWIHDRREQFREIETLRVKRRKRQHGPQDVPGTELVRDGLGR